MRERGTSRGHHGDMVEGMGASMNWFGMFTVLLIVVLVTTIIAYEIGYDKAVKDVTMSKTWLDLNNRKH